MKARIALIGLAMLMPVHVLAGAEKAQPAAVGSDRPAAMLQVETLMREVEKHNGPLRVEGVVSRVFPKEQQLGLIDAAEFKKCGVVTCADMVLPVQWTGAMPEVKDLVRLEGEIRKTGGKLEFVARSLEKAPAK